MTEHRDRQRWRKKYDEAFVDERHGEGGSLSNCRRERDMERDLAVEKKAD